MHNKHSKIAEFYDNTYYANAVLPVEEKLNRHLLNLAKKLSIAKGANFLDVACGTGAWLNTLAKQGCIPHGVDISEKAIAICRQRLPQGDFHVGVAETLPYPDNTFDWVSCLGSLEHFIDQPSALREMRRVAKPQAKLLILVPNAGFLPHRFGLYRGTYQTAARETVRTLAEWQTMFVEAELEVIEKWKDLHVLNANWLFRRPWFMVPLRMLQAGMLPLWPLSWQYQVYHLCRIKAEHHE